MTQGLTWLSPPFIIPLPVTPFSDKVGSLSEAAEDHARRDSS